MQTDVLIIGQGIAGSLLYWQLKKAGIDCLVMDTDQPHSATLASAGIINPVTGRRYNSSWNIETFMPFAVQTYEELGEHFQTRYIRPRTVLDFFPSPFSGESFLKHLEEGNTYLHSYPDQNQFNALLHYEFGVGEIRPAWSVHPGLLLADIRRELLQAGRFVADCFEEERLQLLEDGVRYGDIHARKLIFCDGVASASHSYFRLLPFALNKGEALIIHAEGLSTDHIYKKSIMVCPLPQQHHYWVGSLYQREFEDAKPTEAFREQFMAQLKHFFKIPFKLVDHRSGIRPATLERRPFVGFHPVHEQLGIFNGLGTKGISLAPWFAAELAAHLSTGAPVTPEADVRRFTRVLSR